MIVRSAKLDDLNGIMGVEAAEYSPIGWQASKEVIKYRLENCFFKKPGDLFWVAEDAGKIMGYITAMIIHYDINNLPKTREEAIGYKVGLDGKVYGFGTNHNQKGNALYVMSIGVLEKGKGIASSLIQRTQDFVKANNLQYRAAGIRTSFHSHRKKNVSVTPEEYLNLRRIDGRVHDNLMRLYSKHGFESLGLHRNYVPENGYSEGWDYYMVWKNPNFMKRK